MLMGLITHCVHYKANHFKTMPFRDHSFAFCQYSVNAWQKYLNSHIHVTDYQLAGVYILLHNSTVA